MWRPFLRQLLKAQRNKIPVLKTKIPLETEKMAVQIEVAPGAATIAATAIGIVIETVTAAVTVEN